MKVIVEKSDGVTTITINRPEVRNAVDSETATQLADAFRAFESDPDAKVAVLTGAKGHFSSIATPSLRPNTQSKTRDGQV